LTFIEQFIEQNIHRPIQPGGIVKQAIAKVLPGPRNPRRTHIRSLRQPQQHACGQGVIGFAADDRETV